MPTTNKKPIEDIIPKEEIQIWPANKIRYAYLESNYYKKVGPLSKSCMKYKENQRALNFYIKNNVKIVVIATNTNKIKARALLWENVNAINCDKKYTFLDRVYYSEEEQKKLYLAFAEKNKFLHYPTKKELYIKDIILKNIVHLPYTDTFKFLYPKKKLLSRRPFLPFDQSDRIELSHTGNGGYVLQLDKNAVKEVFSKIYISKKDSVYIKQYDGYVLKIHLVKINNILYSLFDITKLTQLKENVWCLTKNIVKEVFTNHKIDKTSSKHINKYAGYVNEENIICINNEIYSKFDDCVIKYGNNKYYLKKHCFYNTLLKTYLPKDVAVLAYKLGKPFYRNAFIFRDALFGSEVVGGDLQSIDQLSDTPKLIGPYYIDPNTCPCTELNTGEYIINEGLDKNYLIRRGGKYRLRHLHKFTDKKQLLLFK